MIAECWSDPLIIVFTSKDSGVFTMTKHGFKIFSLSFLFTGVNIFASALFTAFSNGKISAILSFLRTFVFLIMCLFVLPTIWNIDGVWLALPIAEALALIASVYYLIKFKNVYHY